MTTKQAVVKKSTRSLPSFWTLIFFIRSCIIIELTIIGTIEKLLMVTSLLVVFVPNSGRPSDVVYSN
jgi:hypothetical protein